MMLSTQSTDQSASSGVRQSTPLAPTGSFITRGENLTRRDKTVSTPVRKVSSAPLTPVENTKSFIKKTEKTVSQRVKK